MIIIGDPYFICLYPQLAAMWLPLYFLLVAPDRLYDLSYYGHYCICYILWITLRIVSGYICLKFMQLWCWCNMYSIYLYQPLGFN